MHIIRNLRMYASCVNMGPWE